VPDQPQNVVSGNPNVKLAGSPLTDIQKSALAEAIVDLDATRPGMFVLRFHQSVAPGQVAGLNPKIGDPVEILEGGTSTSLIKGEVTSLEVDYGNGGQRLVVRGYDKSHRLHRARKYRAFTNQKDSDIASTLASEGGLGTGTITVTSSVHKYLVQINQTDWEFLKWRAEENGLTVDAADGNLNVRKPDSQTTPGPTLSVTKSLLAFRPRLNAPPVGSVTVRSWDESQKQKFENKVSSLPSSTAADLTDTPSALVTKLFSTPPEHLSSIRTAEADGDVSATATALAARFADSFIEAEAVAYGDPALKPGVQVTVQDAGDTFSGKYRITSARHVFNSDVRYQTTMRFSGIQDRSLLGLTSNGNGHGPATRRPRIEGVVSAIVTDTKDPDKRARVKLKFPWIDDTVQTEWCRTMQFGGGPNYGAMILPEVGDEVLVAFEQGDPSRPYVLGGLYNGNDKPLAAISDVVDGSSGKAKMRAFASRLGHTLVFDDDEQSKSGIHLLTADTNFELYLDQKNTKITIDAKSGKVEIHGAQDVSVKSDQNINIEATQNLTLKGTAGVSIESSANATVKATGQMEVSGATTAVKGSGTLDLDGGGMASLHAGVVKIN
jgi:phage protein D/phage baseplate assembly protein gpV